MGYKDSGLFVSLCLIVSSVAGEGYWDIQLSPQSVCSVPFGSGRITVWEHASSKGRYYAMPLVYLQHNSSEVIENLLTDDVELTFNVLMWSIEAQEAVYRHIKSKVNASVSTEQVELLPTEKIRIVWRDRVRPLSRHFTLADHWKSNTHLPSTTQFQFVCKEMAKCEALNEAMRTRPEMFSALELEYIINGQRSARRSLTVTGSHVIRGRLFTQLANMPGQETSAERYVTSDDMKTIASESVTNVIASITSDADYIDTGDEISMENTLQLVLQRQQVSTENFQPEMWNSVFWNPTWARPDKLTRYMNKVLSKDTSDSRQFILDESQRSRTMEGSGGGSFLGIVEVSGSAGGSSSSQSKVQKDDVLNTLRERHNHVEWDGEQFRVKPMKLYRLNVANLNTSANIATANIQVRRYETVHSIKLRLGEGQSTASLTPQLVQARLAQKIEEAKRFVLQKVTNAEAKIRTQERRMTSKISESDAGWKARLERINGKINAWPDYCRIPNQDCAGRDLRHLHRDVQGCKNACDADCRCKGFEHRGRDCWLKLDTCTRGQLRPFNGDYHIKVTRSPVHFGTMKWAFNNRKPDICSDPCDVII